MADAARSRRAHALRGLLLLLAAGCLAWAVAAGPPAVGAHSGSRVGARIASGESFRPQALQQILDAPSQRFAGSDCYASDLRGRMMIAARLAELALDGGQMQEVGPRLEVARDSAQRSLACDPYDPQGWLTLYWASGHLDGFGDEVYGLMAMSYLTGPLEGWVAFRRNPQAIAVLGALPEPAQAAALREWRRLVADWLHLPAAIALERAAPDARLRLLEERARIPSASWIGFARFLERRGSPIVLPDVPDLRR